MKLYGTIGSGRLLNIRVILDGENASENIRKLKYYQVDMTRHMTFYVRSKEQ